MSPLRDVSRAVQALAEWTQHHPTCARAETTALRCTCGLNEAWLTVENELRPPIPRCPINPDGHQYVTDRDWERNLCAHCGQPEPPLSELLGAETP